MLQSLWQRIKKWCFHSLTIAWGYFKVTAGAFLLSFHELFDYIGTFITDPDVKSSLSAFNFPAYVGLGLAIIGFITLSARLRTVTKPTDANNQITVKVKK